MTNQYFWCWHCWLTSQPGERSVSGALSHGFKEEASRLQSVTVTVVPWLSACQKPPALVYVMSRLGWELVSCWPDTRTPQWTHGVHGGLAEDKGLKLMWQRFVILYTHACISLLVICTYNVSNAEIQVWLLNHRAFGDEPGFYGLF